MDDGRHPRRRDGLAMLDRIVARAWLGGPNALKYRVSRWVSDRRNPLAWDLPFSAALRKHGISLNAATDLHSGIEPFRGKVFWQPDPLWGAGDYVAPPITVLDNQGDDCDAIGWLNACAVEHALGPLGWRGLIVSYLADPWPLSHVFCAAVDPAGRIHVVQPQPARWQPADMVHVWGDTFVAFEEAAAVVASLYPVRGRTTGARVVALDVRDTRWRVIRPWGAP